LIGSLLFAFDVSYVSSRQNTYLTLLHLKKEKTSRRGGLTAATVAILLLLGACERPAGGEPPPELAAAPVDSGCGGTGRLSTRLYGSIARQISWSDAELRCESMLRPDGEGVRLRFIGDAANSRLAIILAMPEMRRDGSNQELPTVVTLTVEGSGRFFSTPTLESCWSDIETQAPIEQGGDLYDVSGTLYCVAPLGEINGDAAISIPRLEFRSIVDWSPT